MCFIVALCAVPAAAKYLKKLELTIFLFAAGFVVDFLSTFIIHNPNDLPVTDLSAREHRFATIEI